MSPIEAQRVEQESQVRTTFFIGQDHGVNHAGVVLDRRCPSRPTAVALALRSPVMRWPIFARNDRKLEWQSRSPAIKREDILFLESLYFSIAPLVTKAGYRVQSTEYDRRNLSGLR